MCGCILKKNRAWHNFSYQILVIDTETGCALHWVIINPLQWPQRLHFWEIYHLRFDSLSTTSADINYKWGTNEVFHHLFTFSDQFPYPNLQEAQFFWSYCQLELPFTLSSYKLAHSCAYSHRLFVLVLKYYSTGRNKFMFRNWWIRREKFVFSSGLFFSLKAH